MRILFVCSGNKPDGIGILVKNQAESLIKSGIEVEYFPILGKGLPGYLKSVFKLRKTLYHKKFDLIHAHYAFSAYVASLAGVRPLIVSLMGSDINNNRIHIYIVKLFYLFFKWNKIILKSQKLKTQLGLKNCEIIPNGVDTDHFRPLDKKSCMEELNWGNSRINILFVANPARPEKNFTLAENAFRNLKDSSLSLRVLDSVSYEIMPVYYNAADVILLTSRWEGSPNVIKEAMACNRPIVSTDVGDVRELFKNVDGCFIATYDFEDIASKIKQALDFETSSTGRLKVFNTGLNSAETAKKIINLYSDLIKDQMHNMKVQKSNIN